jgi:hypothetical protein
MQRIFDEYGLPDAIRSDNGSPFSSRGVAGLSTLSVWWHKLGIRHERIDPGHPEQNGRHERMHLDLKRETASPPATTFAKQQLRFDQFRARFNRERRHEALEQKTPHEFYDVSSRRLPQPWWGKDFEYDMEAEALRVSKDGQLATHRGAFFLSTTLAHELIEIDWYERNRARVLFGTLKLGELVAKAKRRQLRFFPVESVDVNQPATITTLRSRKPSPMSSDNPSPISPLAHEASLSVSKTKGFEKTFARGYGTEGLVSGRAWYSTLLPRSACGAAGHKPLGRPARFPDPTLERVRTARDLAGPLPLERGPAESMREPCALVDGRALAPRCPTIIRRDRSTRRAPAQKAHRA